MGSFNHRKLFSEPNTTESCCFTVIFSPPFQIEPKKVQHISPLLIIIVALLGGCFLLVSYYAIIVKYCSNLRNRRRPPPQNEENSDTHEDFFDENHGPVVDHPIWFIHTVGLAQSVIDSIGVLKYKKGEGLLEGTDCSICLSEFEDDEIIRLLPKCSHAFHLSCIDTWLRSHTNCPSCRAPVVASPVVSSSTEVGPNSNNYGLREEIQVENSGSEGGFGTDQNGEDVLNNIRLGVPDESEEDERSNELKISKKDLLSPLDIPEFRVFSDLSDNHRVMQNRRQPLRSASMDFNPASIFCFSVGNSLPLEEEDEGSSMPLEIEKKSNLSPGLGRLMGSSSKETLFSKSSVSMKRSFSSGGKLVSSKSSQNRSSILPMVQRGV